MMTDWLNTIRPMAAELPESGIIEVVNYGRERPGILQFWAGEGDQPTPQFICETAIQALRDGQTFYTYQRGIPALRQAVANYLQRHFGVAVDSERVIIAGSGMQAILQTVQTLAGPGDEIVVISPVWPNIFAAIHMQEAIAKPVILKAEEDDWHLDLNQLFEACGPRTKALFINTPGNPTGWIMSEDDMIAVRDFARQRGLWLITDEVYNQFVYDRPIAKSFLEITEPQDRLIVTNTFSKNWSMTGWRIGWVVIPESQALGQVYENLVQYQTSGSPAFLQQGCVTAVNEGDAYIKQLVERCQQCRDMIVEQLQVLPNVRMIPPRGAFYAFFQVDGEPDSMAFAKRMIDVANVGLAPGIAFGPGGEGFNRICFATSPEMLSQGIERLVAALT